MTEERGREGESEREGRKDDARIVASTGKRVIPKRTPIVMPIGRGFDPTQRNKEAKEKSRFIHHSGVVGDEHELSVILFDVALVRGELLYTNERNECNKCVNLSESVRDMYSEKALQGVRVGYQQFPTEDPSVA
jgi:hypothetical protein